MINSLPKNPRIGFLKELSIPDNFNEMNSKKIFYIFYGKIDTDFLTEKQDIIADDRFNFDQ